MSGLNMDWLALERNLRGVLREYKAGRLKAEEALFQVDEVLGVGTGRGYELPPGPMRITWPPLCADCGQVEEEHDSSGHRFRLPSAP